MKLKRFDASSILDRGEQRPKLSYTTKNGMTMNAALCALLGAQHGDGVVLLQDEENKTDWYIGKDAKQGIPLNKRRSGLAFGAAALRRSIIESLETDLTAGSMLVGTEAITHEGIKLYPVITSSLVYKSRKPQN